MPLQIQYTVGCKQRPILSILLIISLPKIKLSMKFKRTVRFTVILFFISVQFVVFGQPAVLGSFIESSTCPFELPQGLKLGEHFRFGYVDVPEFHSNPNSKTIRLAALARENSRGAGG